MAADDPFHEAIEALRATGRKVEPTSDDLSLWLGLMTGPERLQ